MKPSHSKGIVALSDLRSNSFRRRLFRLVFLFKWERIVDFQFSFSLSLITKLHDFSLRPTQDRYLREQKRLKTFYILSITIRTSLTSMVLQSISNIDKQCAWKESRQDADCDWNLHKIWVWKILVDFYFWRKKDFEKILTIDQTRANDVSEANFSRCVIIKWHIVFVYRPVSLDKRLDSWWAIYNFDNSVKTFSWDSNWLFIVQTISYHSPETLTKPIVVTSTADCKRIRRRNHIVKPNR